MPFEDNVIDHRPNGHSNDHTVPAYDRLYGSAKLAGMMTPPATIKISEPITGRTITFVVQTARIEDPDTNKIGDRVFLECVDENLKVTRLAIPPKVTEAIARQHDTLTARRRSIASRLAAKDRMDRGEVPGFMRDWIDGKPPQRIRRKKAKRVRSDAPR
jgi:hypothetical protein